MRQIEFYRTENGREPVREWLEDLPQQVRNRVEPYINRLELGLSKKSVRSLGDQVFELKMNFGPGYRVYFGQIGDCVILLLCAGDKASQFRDIHKAKEYWRHRVSK